MPTQLPQAIVPVVRLSTSGSQDIGLGMEGGSGSLAIGSFLPVHHAQWVPGQASARWLDWGPG